jgi:hypothetical protein
MFAHGSRNADSPRRAFCLKPRSHIYRVTMQIGPANNSVADVDADPKADGSIRRLVTIIDGHLLLHPHGTAHRPVNAIENDEQGIDPGLNDPAAVFLDRWVDYFPAKHLQPFKRSSVIKPNQTAVTDHNCRDQFSPIWRLANQV